MGIKDVTEFRVIVVADSDATIAVTSFEGVLYTASAKRCPGDKNNPDTGFELAISRLFAKMSSRIARHAHGTVKHADDVRTDKWRRKSLRESYVTDVLAEMHTQPAGRHRRRAAVLKTDPLHPFDPDPGQP